MKIVIITANFYPSLSPRSQRATELAKELARRNNTVIVYSLLGGFDYSSFENDFGVIVKNLGVSRWGYPDSENHIRNSLFTRAVKKIAGNLLWLPDRELIPMVKKVIRDEKRIDLLITIAIPHVINYAASICDLSKIKNWISDCGDPFTKNPYTIGLYPKYLENYERQWCEKCNHIVVPVDSARKGYFSQYNGKISVIPQGYDFSHITVPEYKKNRMVTFAYAGAFYRELRDPSNFLEYLAGLNIEFEFWLFGSSWSFACNFKDGVLNQHIVNGGTLSRERLIPKLASMDFLINMKNNSSVQQPSKLIDYALAKRPVLSISSDFKRPEQLVFESFIAGDYSNKEILPDIKQFDIKNVVDKFISLTNA